MAEERPLQRKAFTKKEVHGKIPHDFREYTICRDSLYSSSFFLQNKSVLATVDRLICD